jgi:endoglucanase
VLSGDWDGDGVDGVGVYYRDQGRFFLRDSLASDPIDQFVTFGSKGVDLFPLSGRWSIP